MKLETMITSLTSVNSEVMVGGKDMPIDRERN